MNRAFTLIELIFVIVIIGILAVIGIPKLSATRDDAKRVVELNNIANCIKDIANSYTSRHTEDNNTPACIDLKCATLNLGDTNDGNITVTVADSSDGKPKFCDYVKTASQKRQLSGEHTFGGNKVVP